MKHKAFHPFKFTPNKQDFFYSQNTAAGWKLDMCTLNHCGYPISNLFD